MVRSTLFRQLKWRPSKSSKLRPNTLLLGHIFFILNKFHMTVLCKTLIPKIQSYLNGIPYKLPASEPLPKPLENTTERFQPKTWKNENWGKSEKLKISSKTYFLKVSSFRKSFFVHSCALKIKKWCEALSPDSQNDVPANRQNYVQTPCS